MPEGVISLQTQCNIYGLTNLTQKTCNIKCNTDKSGIKKSTSVNMVNNASRSYIEWQKFQTEKIKYNLNTVFLGTNKPRQPTSSKLLTKHISFVYQATNTGQGDTTEEVIYHSSLESEANKPLPPSPRMLSKPYWATTPRNLIILTTSYEHCRWHRTSTVLFRILRNYKS